MKVVPALAEALGEGVQASPGIESGPGSGPGPKPARDAALDAAIRDSSESIDTSALIGRLTRFGQTVSVAESLTGGLVLAALTSVPGASAVVRGGVVAYAEAVKAAVLGVDPEVLRRTTAVSSEVAVQMAHGCQSLMGATYGVATTGEAGPDSSSGRPIGTFFVAVSGPRGDVFRHQLRSGGRAQVRRAAAEAALALLAAIVSDAAEADPAPDGAAGGDDPGAGLADRRAPTSPSVGEQISGNATFDGQGVPCEGGRRAL